jgi:hypothetical protein
MNKVKKGQGGAQVVECLPRELKALSSNPFTANIKNKDKNCALIK